MTITFNCPYCGKSLNAEEDRIGESGPCAECGAPITVPDPKNRFPGSALDSVFPRDLGIWDVLFGAGALLMLLALFVFAGRRSGGYSRRTKCQYNLRNIALAAQGHHHYHSRFPLASSQPFTGHPGTNALPHPAGYSWQVGLMPFLDLNQKYEQWKLDSQDFNLGPFDPANDPVNLTHVISLPTCPSISTKQVDIQNSEYQLLKTPGGQASPGSNSYIAFAASHFTNDTGPGQLYESDSQSPFDGNGAFPFPQAAADIQKGISLVDITDGLSFTVIFCESLETSYAAWCDGQAMWSVGAWPGSQKMPTVNGGPNGSLGWPDSDQQSRASIGSGSDSDPAEMYLPASRYHAQYDRRWGPSSHHSGDVMHAFADGSVRPISPDIDRNVYLQLISRDGAERFDLSEID